MLRELHRIKVPFDVALLGENQNARRHYGTKTKIKNQAKLAASKAWMASGRFSVDPSDLPVTLNVIIRRGRRMDQANIWGALKAPIDSLFARQQVINGYIDGLVTPDDSEQYVIAGVITQLTGDRYKSSPSIEFVICTENWR